MHDKHLTSHTDDICAPITKWYRPLESIIYVDSCNVLQNMPRTIRITAKEQYGSICIAQ